MARNIARIVSIAVFLSDIIVLIIVLALLWTMSSRTDQGKQPCEKLCFAEHCDCRTEALQNRLKKIFTETFTAETKNNQPKFEFLHDRQGSALLRSIKPIARVGGSKQAMRKEDMSKDLMTIRKWETKGRSFCYVRNGMGYRNGRLVAPVDGLYNIYTFLDLFMEYINRNGETMINIKKHEDAIQHAVYKFNIRNNREEEILTTYKPYYFSRNGRFNFYETYLSADVKLKAGDEVYLKVSNVSFIQNPSKNFFGMHLL